MKKNSLDNSLRNEEKKSFLSSTKTRQSIVIEIKLIFEEKMACEYFESTIKLLFVPEGKVVFPCNLFVAVKSLLVDDVEECS